MGAARRAVRQRSKPHQDGRAVHSVDLAHQGMGSIRTLPQAAHGLGGRQHTFYQLQVALDGLGDSHTGWYSTLPTRQGMAAVARCSPCSYCRNNPGSFSVVT